MENSRYICKVFNWGYSLGYMDKRTKKAYMIYLPSLSRQIKRRLPKTVRSYAIEKESFWIKKQKTY
jgi:hypothetical protein